MSIGWLNIDNKISGATDVKSAGLTPDIGNQGQWVTLRRITKDDLPAEGPSVLDPELYATLPAITDANRPKDIQTRWLRVDTNDPTKRHGHAVGTIRAWASTGGGGMEFVTDADLPIDLQMWQNGKTTLRVTWIIKVFTPAAYIADRIA